MSDLENSIITIPTSQYSHCWKNLVKFVKKGQMNALQRKTCKIVSKTQYLPLYNYKVASIGFYSPLSLVLRLKVFFNNALCVLPCNPRWEFGLKIPWKYLNKHYVLLSTQKSWWLSFPPTFSLVKVQIFWEGHKNLKKITH